MLQTNVAEKIQTHILCSITFSRKSYPVWNYVEKYGRIGQATDGTVILHMAFARWITKATGTHSWLRNTGLHPNKRYAKVSQCSIYMYIASLFQICLVTVALPAGTFMVLPHSGAAFEGGKWGDRPRPRSWGGPALQAYEFVKLYSPVNWKCWYMLRLKSFFKVKFRSVVLGCLLYRNRHNQCLR